MSRQLSSSAPHSTRGELLEVLGTRPDTHGPTTSTQSPLSENLSPPADLPLHERSWHTIRELYWISDDASAHERKDRRSVASESVDSGVTSNASPSMPLCRRYHVPIEDPSEPKDVIPYILEALVEVHHICLMYGFKFESQFLEPRTEEFKYQPSLEWLADYRPYFRELRRNTAKSDGELKEGVRPWLIRLTGYIAEMHEPKPADPYVGILPDADGDLQADDRVQVADIANRALHSREILGKALEAKVEFQGRAQIEFRHRWDSKYIVYMKWLFWDNEVIRIHDLQRKFPLFCGPERFLRGARDNILVARTLLVWMMEAKAGRRLKAELWNEYLLYETEICNHLRCAANYDPREVPVIPLYAPAPSSLLRPFCETPGAQLFDVQKEGTINGVETEHGKHGSAKEIELDEGGRQTPIVAGS